MPAVSFRTLLSLALSIPAVLSGCGQPVSGGGEDAGALVDTGPAGDASSIDAGASCGAVGTVEAVPCGACGAVDRFCGADGAWVYGECRDEGECSPGDEQSLACGLCGTRVLRCSEACEWEPGACEGEGECEPGLRLPSNEGCPEGTVHEALCNASCMFEPVGECQSPTRCETPGESQRMPCGTMCGTIARFCTSENEWTYGECVEAGECVPGTVGTGACGPCGMQPTRCSSACEWEPAGECVAAGECTPGESVATTDGCVEGGTRVLTCNASCTYEAGACAWPPLEMIRGLGGPAGFGEGSLPLADDATSAAIDVMSAFPFGLTLYGTTYTSLHVGNNGHVSFGGIVAPFPMPDFPIADRPLIAPWWGDVDTRAGGRPARNNVHWDLDGSRFVATWHLVGRYNSRVDLLNSFQIVLTDRRDVARGDFDVEIRYERCEWAVADSGGVTKAGFDSGNRIDFLALPGSGTASVVDLCTTSNVGPPGLWRYEVRGGIPR